MLASPSLLSMSFLKGSLRKGGFYAIQSSPDKGFLKRCFLKRFF